jgi:collagen type VI alpha
VDVPITDDLVLENTESFFVTLERNGLDSRIDLEPVDGEIEIIDNDVAVVGLEMTAHTVTEGALPAVEVCTVVYQPDITCPIAFPFSLTFNTSDDTAVVEEDYLDSDTIQLFGACARRRCIFVTIVDDNIPEVPERLLISIRDPSHPNITLNPDVGFIEIYEITTDIPPMVNDTVTGDPLMTVPVNTNPNVSTLCYEVHGHADKFFNLVSDTCVAVNAHYVDSGINNSRINLNVVDAIGVRAVNTQGNCVNIHVKLEGCAVTVEGLNISMFRNYGIVIRQYSNRVRISVPNCDDKDLVMWVFCKTGRTEDPVTWEYFSFNFLRFMVMRGLNLDERSHGLIGQFWNVPVTVTENTGTFQGRERNDDYVVSVGGRKFVGLLSHVTWEFEEKPCLYAGNSQAGPLGEHVLGPNGEDDINESVIEGMYKDYEVESLFSPNFKYAHINEDNCMTK